MSYCDVVQLVRKGRRGKMGGEGTLVLSVHHPEPSVREAAVRQLGKLLRHKAKVTYFTALCSNSQKNQE